MRIRRVLVPLLLGTSVAACSQAAASSPAVTMQAAATPTVQPTSAARPTPEFPAPAELQAKWRVALAAEDIATLTITESGYTISRSRPMGNQTVVAIGRGRLAVEGDEILFSHSNICAGEGRYRWSVEGDVLSLESVETDACPGRAAALDGFEYARVE